MQADVGEKDELLTSVSEIRRVFSQTKEACSDELRPIGFIRKPNRNR